MFFRLFIPLFLVAGISVAQVKSGAEESYSVVQGRVQGMEARIRSTEAEIQKLIQEKQSAKNTEQANEIIRNMLTLHKQLNEQVKEYEQQRNLLRYRYPDRGQAGARQYERIEVRSLEEMESRMSLGTEVDKTMQSLRRHYPSKESEKNKDSGSSSETKEKTQAPSLMEPVILKK